MNEKATNMEEGRIGREGKRSLGLLRETTFKSETPFFKPTLWTTFSAW